MRLITRRGAEPALRRLGFRSEHAMSVRPCLTGREIHRLPFPDHVWTCAQDHLEAILGQYTGDEPCMVYGIGDPSTGGVFVPTDATDRWIPGLPWHPELGERLEDYGQARCEDLVRSGAGVPDLAVEILDIRAFEMTAFIADRYRAGRVILAGDAARAFTPSTGMGLNLAIHDGAVLAQYLADAVSLGDEPEMLDRYEQACRPLAERLLEPDLAPAL